MKSIILKLIKFYQNTHIFHLPIFKTLFLTDSSCRFIPSCSNYTYQAIEKYGTINGLFKGFKRILKCHPWSSGGNDPLK